MKAIYADLNSINIDDQRIHYEFFGAGETLQTPTPSSDSDAAILDKSKKPVTVKFVKSGLKVTWQAGQGNLLELAESAGLSPAFSCRSGVCQTCSTKIIKGDVDYAEQPMIPAPANEALICCSTPHTVDQQNEGDAPVLALDL